MILNGMEPEVRFVFEEENDAVTAEQLREVHAAAGEKALYRFRYGLSGWSKPGFKYGAGVWPVSALYTNGSFLCELRERGQILEYLGYEALGALLDGGTDYEGVAAALELAVIP